MAETVTVVGSGTMGRGIAYLALVAGCSVRICDVDEAQLERARDWVQNRCSRDAVDGAGLLVSSDYAEACGGAGFVIEAVVENLEVKASVLGKAAAAARDDAILATNTSGLSVTALGSRLDDPTRLVGMHFFNPPHRMKLCEVVVGDASSRQAVEAATQLARRMGKEPVEVADTPGFVASRMNCALGNEALAMLQEGVASAEAIDTAARLGLNHPMGPLELLDLVGLDVRLAALETLHAAYGDRFRPTPLHRRLVAAGRLGIKSGRGVYTYDEDGRRAASEGSSI